MGKQEENEEASAPRSPDGGDRGSEGSHHEASSPKRRRTATVRGLHSKQYPVQPDVVQHVTVPKSHVNHTYYNFSNMPRDPHYSMPQTSSRMTFHDKIYHLLSHAKEDNRGAIRWCRGGRAFEIADEAKLTRRGMLQKYFGYGTMPQFRRQLLCHGYKRLLGNIRAETHYSEFLLQGLPHVLRLSPEPFDCRSLMSDVDNEPDFESINRLYPLPGVHQLSLVQEARIKLSAKGLVVSDNVFDAVAQKWTRYPP